MKLSLPSLSAVPLALLSAAAIALLYNQPLWVALNKVSPLASPEGMLFAAAVFLLHAGALTVLFLLFGIGRALKPLIILFFLLAAVIGYFETRYGVIIDQSMLRNMLQTDRRETGELLTAPLALHFVLYGLLPAAAVGFMRIKRRTFLRGLSLRTGAVFVITAAVAGTLFIGYKDFAYIGREHKEIRMLANPLALIYSAYKYAASRHAHPAEVMAIGLDAVQHSQQGPRKKTVVVFVVGETAREQEFSLNGYGRRTDPFLERDGVVSFDHAYACGTSTAESLPCMFTHLEPDRYAVDTAARYENVLDVLTRARVSVLWRDNNSGCKGVCARIRTELLSNAAITDLCKNGECYDEVLLDHLQEHLDHADTDTLIVLHQKGSHGPAYFRRHPKRFSVFLPECTSNSPQDCKADEIVNAYDNTILYTDYFLDRTIAFLKENAAKADTLLIYFSDHGESLGENGIFLHGLPKIVAPDVQRHVPFIIWMSDGYVKRYHVDAKCLSLHHTMPYSHANIFHTLLGAFDVRTTLYRADRDVLASCRNE